MNGQGDGANHRPAAPGAGAGPDARIRDLASRQHGVVARSQLLQEGVPAHRIDYRLRCGRLHPLYRGVYRVGPVDAPRTRIMAAVLACGDGAVVSHRSAAELWGLVAAPSGRAPIDVTIRRNCRGPGGGRQGAGVCVHRVARLLEDEVTRLGGLPITTAARTLVDLASSVRGRDLERAVAEANREHLADVDAIERVLARHPRSPGRARLRSLLGGDGGPAFTRSEAEARFLALIRKARLLVPEANVVIRGCEVDFLWRVERLIVEVDGFRFHSLPEAFERDRSRDIMLTAAGYRVIRVTWRQLTREPEALLAQVAQTLARAQRG